MSTMTYLAFGFFGYSLGIFRQMIAISICLMGFKYVLERKLYYYIIFILLAMIIVAVEWIFYKKGN